jgi:hypothetical protein
MVVIMTAESRNRPLFTVTLPRRDSSARRMAAPPVTKVSGEDPMRDRVNLSTLRRAFASADRDGEAALNALLYGAGALVASAVLLVTSSPPIVGVALAMVPWLGYAGAMLAWLSPAIEAERSAAQRRLDTAREIRAAAADLLLGEDGTTEQRRAAARLLVGE